jgi:hypothetical protein
VSTTGQPTDDDFEGKANVESSCQSRLMSLVDVVVSNQETHGLNDHPSSIEGSDADDEEVFPLATQQAKRVSTLTYPSFDGGVLTMSPLKDSSRNKGRATRISELSELTSSHSHLIFQDSSGSMQSQLLLGDDEIMGDDNDQNGTGTDQCSDVEREEDQSTKDEVEEDDDYDDIKELPRHLECIPSVDGSDITNSYGTITTSSSSATPPPPLFSPRKARGLARRGTMGGESGCLPAAQPMRRNCHSMSSFPDLVDDTDLDAKSGGTEQPLHGPFLSPLRGTSRSLTIPEPPSHDSNPLLFPLNLSSSIGTSPIPPGKAKADAANNHDSDQSLSLVPVDDHQSPVSATTRTTVEAETQQSKQTNWHDWSAGPFVSPRSIPRSFYPAPETPQHGSNPLLYPQGLSFYPLVNPLIDTDHDHEEGGGGSTSSDPSSARKIASEPPQRENFYNDDEPTLPSSSRHLSSPVRHLREQMSTQLEINLSQRSVNDDPDLHAPIDLSRFRPDGILDHDARSKEATLASTPSSSTAVVGNITKPTRNLSLVQSCDVYPKRKLSKRDPPKPFLPPPPRRTTSYPPSRMYDSVTNNSSNTDSSTTTTTSGGLPSESSLLTSPKSHSSRFTASGADPDNCFDLVVDRAHQIEPSVFTEEDDEDDEEEDDDDDEPSNGPRTTNEEGSDGTDDSESDASRSDSEYYEEYDMSVVDEDYEPYDSEAESEEGEPDTVESDTDAGDSEVAPLAQQDEQYAPLNDIDEDDENGDTSMAPRHGLRWTSPSLSAESQPRGEFPSLVSMTSSHSGSTNTSVGSSVTLLRVKMCPMEICYTLDGEENAYTGFYSGPM